MSPKLMLHWMGLCIILEWISAVMYQMHMAGRNHVVVLTEIGLQPTSHTATAHLCLYNRALPQKQCLSTSVSKVLKVSEAVPFAPIFKGLNRGVLSGDILFKCSHVVAVEAVVLAQ